MSIRFDIVNGFNIYINTPSCETGSIIFNTNFITMEKEIKYVYDCVNCPHAGNLMCCHNCPLYRKK